MKHSIQLDVTATSNLALVSLHRRWLLRAVALVLIAIGAPLAARAQTAPTVSVSFSPTSISSGGTSQLTITLGNPNGTVATLQAPLIDSLPSGLTIEGAGGSCPGAISTTSGAITYLSRSTIPIGNCTIVASVKASSTSNSYLTDTIGAHALQTNFGVNNASASATLTVRAAATVPNLYEYTQTAAATALQAVGLTLGTVGHSTSKIVAYNLVISQGVKAGTAVPAGTAVSIVISTGATGNVSPSNPLLGATSSLDPSQASLAKAVDQVCANLKASSTLTTLQRNLFENCGAIINSYSGTSNQAGLTNTLNAISGKQTTAQQRTGIEFSGMQFQSIGARLAELRQGVSGFSLANLDTGGMPLPGDLGQLLALLKDPSSEPASSPGSSSDAPISGGGAGDTTSGGLSRWGFFVNGNLRRGTQDTDEYETGFNFKSSGVTIGTDYRFTDHLVFGVAYGHQNGNSEFTDGSGRVDSRSNTGSLYGTYYNGPFYVDAIGTFGHIDYMEDRTTQFTLATGTTGSASTCAGTTVCNIDTYGSTDAREYAFGGSVGYSFHAGGLVAGPDIALDYTHVAVNGFSESDPNQTGMALAYGGQLGESLLLKPGAHISYALSTPIAVILPQVRVHYIHEFKDDQRGLNVHYIDDPTVNSPSGPISNFLVFTDPPDRNYADYAASISAQFPFGLVAFVDYSSLAGYSQLQTHELTFGVRFQAVVR